MYNITMENFFNIDVGYSTVKIYTDKKFLPRIEKPLAMQ